MPKADIPLREEPSWKAILNRLQQSRAEIERGGGASRIAKQHKKGRMTARERVQQLIDPESFFLEIGLFSGFGLYQEWGGAPASGLITGIGQIQGRSFVLIANDATVKAGAFFPTTTKKLLHAQQIAMDNRIPLIYLVDSAGVFLPLQAEIFPDEDDFGRIFRNNARISAQGIPQIAAIMGSCVAGGAYLPVMCDKILMTEGSGLYIAGPALVKAAIGQETSSDDLGGAKLHAQLSGTVDFREENDPDCLRRLRALVAEMGEPDPPRLERQQPGKPARKPTEWYRSSQPGTKSFGLEAILDLVFDQANREVVEQPVERAHCHLDGWPVAVVNLSSVSRLSTCEELESLVDFLSRCRREACPVILLNRQADGDSESGHSLAFRKTVVEALSGRDLPKIVLFVDGVVTPGDWISGRSLQPRFSFAWPTAGFSAQGPRGTARPAHKGAKNGADPTPRDIREAAAHLWIDGVIAPDETRSVLARCVEAIAHSPGLK